MLFNSDVFLFLFLPVAWLVFWLLKTKRQRHVWLTVTGYAFYAGWNWKFCFLMLFSTLVSYGAGLLLLREDLTERERKRVLVIPVVADLLLLGFFKYANFTLDSIASLSVFAGHPLPARHFDITLPIGISFYTFHTISYVVDSYRRRVTPTKDFWEFASYVSLFSQLVAGPIVRFKEVKDDFENLGLARRGDRDHLGWSFFIIGLAQKVLIADLIASIIDPSLLEFGKLGTVSAWACMIGYAYQIYFDFAGYSNMAIGLGCLFGIRIPRNFDSPYQSDGPADFWRRWHISLSSCLRDYLYIPLGGNRLGVTRTYVNLLATMLIGGLWHGANWTFVAWGAWHGLLLCGNRIFESSWNALWKPLRQGLTFVLVVIGWVFFRAQDFTMAADILRHMFTWTPSPPLPVPATLAVLLAIGFVFSHLGKNTSEMTHEWTPVMRAALLALLAVCILRTLTSHGSPFLYFQF